jgi:hypothetical protein
MHNIRVQEERLRNKEKSAHELPDEGPIDPS